MPAKDISRFLFQPEKRYSGVRMQQGRVILDSDWNESERIDDEEARRAHIEIICSKGTSNEGFLASGVVETMVTESPGPGEESPASKESYDFQWDGGSFYAGGLRFETGVERFLTQEDWLQIDADLDNLPARPNASDLTDPDGSSRPRFDLIYLRGWEQCVTAVEDSELRERALGGPDTSVRMRRMRRIEVVPDMPGTCAEAFAALKDRLTGGNPQAFDDANCELLSTARLTVTFTGGDTEDPCRPKVLAGFLGAENQTIRVELTAADRFIWGYDNASPLYRVQALAQDGALVKIKFLTLPRDQAAQPLKGQAVEILPWGALLPNREKVAEPGGHLSTVATSYDPEDNTLTIATPVPQERVNWLDDPNHGDYLSDRDPEDRQKYFYLRLWTGGSGDATQPDHGFAAGNPVELAGTGLNVTFSAVGRRSDHWIIAARPNTPDEVVPWEVKHEAPPVGTRYFFAPLALIRWSVGPNQQVTAEVEDCRSKFRPLCETGGCCTVTVGDGVSSHGDFGSIESALAHLPPGGGEICLLPGVHQANAAINRRRNITIKGCDKRTQVIPREVNREGPIFQVVDSQGVILEHMDLVTLKGTAILLQGSRPGVLKDIDIRHNRILACQQAVEAGDGVGITIRHNRVRMLDKEGAGVAILIQAEDSLIERNDIGVVSADRTPPPDLPEDTPDPVDPCADPELVYRNPLLLGFLLDHLFGIFIAALPVAPFKALGGIRVAAGSERMRVFGNKINGGAGNGVTLGGAFTYRVAEPAEEPEEPMHVIRSPGRQIWGGVNVSTRPLPTIGLLFTRTDSATSVPTTTDSAGTFLITAPAGDYGVRAATPGYRIREVVTEDRGEFGVFHRVGLEEIEPAPDGRAAFLYNVEIDRNEITGMGLSGIGVPREAPGQGAGGALAVRRINRAMSHYLQRLGTPVLGLGIHRNDIHDCLQNPFDGALRGETRERGLGGISLGLCEDMIMSGNRIERNGSRHIDPVCGVFVTRGERVEMRQNLVTENGPRVAAAEADLDRGWRGGIVLRAASSGSDGLAAAGRSHTRRHAVRVHDNVVSQPAGQALTILARGAVSVCHNRFSAELSGPSSLERLAGTVGIVNVGAPLAAPAAAGDLVNDAVVGFVSSITSGETLFSGNQSWLGTQNESIASQVVWTLDDLGFDGNQSTALTDGLMITEMVSFFINTLLAAGTLRATDSRFKEPVSRSAQAVKASLVTLSRLLNTTTDNQGDHCILAHNIDPGRPPHAAGNQVVDATLCKFLNAGMAAPIARFMSNVALQTGVWP